MKFDSQVFSEKKMFWYVCGSPKWVALDEKSKVSLTFGTYTKPCLIRFNISLTSIMILALTVIVKWTFQDFPI